MQIGTIKACESVCKKTAIEKKVKKSEKKTLTSALKSEKVAHTRTIKLKIMRTKTLILSGLLAALSGASALAQVYSLNSVGYINVDVPQGWSIIADQLYATNQQTSQSIDAIFGPTLLNGGATTPDPYAGCILFPYANGGFLAALIVQQTTGAAFWSGTVEAQTTSFNPGQAAFFFNPNADFQITFVGQVPQGTVTNAMEQGFNLVSSIIPQTGAIDTDLGIVPALGDIAFIWQNGGYEAANIYENINNGPAFWSLTSSSTNTVGTGFFYYAASATPNQWIRTFNIN